MRDRMLLKKIDRNRVSIVVFHIKTMIYLRVSTREQTTENQLSDLEALVSEAPSTRPVLLLLSLAIDRCSCATSTG